MKNSLTLFLFCILNAGIGWSQQSVPAKTVSAIKGVVLDAEDKLPVEMSAVALYSIKDSSLVVGISSDLEGNFELKSVPAGNYYLVVTYLGYSPKDIQISESLFKDRVINLGQVFLNTGNFELDEIVITAELPDVILKGDTTQYNADAFQVEDDAVLEDLLAQLPGMEVDDDGKITTATGTKVSRIFVDDEELFSDDPDLLLKNWPAYLIDRVEIFERKSDQALLTGIDDGIRETVINITTKKGMSTDMLTGHVRGGGGAILKDRTGHVPRFSANAALTRTYGKDVYSLIANSNNVNGRKTDAVPGRIEGQGMNTFHDLGFNMQKKIENKWKINGDIRYQGKLDNTEQSSFRQQIFPDSVSYRISESKRHANNSNFNVNSVVEYNIDTLTKIVFRPNITYNHRTADNRSAQTTRAGDRDSSLVNESRSASNSSADEYNIRMKVDFTRRLSERGRRINAGMNLVLHGNNREELKEAQNVFYRDPDRNRNENLRTDADRKRQVYQANVSYIEPLGKYNYLNFFYLAEYSNNRNSNRTYNFEESTDDYTELNGQYSRNSDTRYFRQNIRANLTAEHPKYNYNIGVHVTPTHRNSKTYIKDWFGAGNDSILNHPDPVTETNYAPQLQATYRFRNDTIRRNIQFRYNGHSSQPSVSQLDPTPDNSNPLHIRSGNPDLSGSFDHGMYLEYNENYQLSQRNLKVSLSYNFTRNQIIDFTDYEEATGIQYTNPINRNGGWDFSTNIFYAKPLDQMKRLRFSSQSRFNLRNRLGYTKVNNKSEENDSRATTVSESIQFNYRSKKFVGDLRLSFKYSETHFTLRKDNKRDTYTYNFFMKPTYNHSKVLSISNEVGIRFSETHYAVDDKDTYNFTFRYTPILKFPGDWQVANEFLYFSKRGMSEGYDSQEKIWNAVLSKHIMKRKGTISLQWNDILQESRNTSRNIGAEYYEDVQFFALTSYFMVSFNYKINKMIQPKKKIPKEVEQFVK